MQIAPNRQDFQAHFLLPAELQRKGVFLWQLAEFAWRRREALDAVDHLFCLLQAVVRIRVVPATGRGMTVVSHGVFDPEAAGLAPGADWPSIVAASTGWAREFLLTFRFDPAEPWATRVPLFLLSAYQEGAYRGLHA